MMNLGGPATLDAVHPFLLRLFSDKVIIYFCYLFFFFFIFFYSFFFFIVDYFILVIVIYFCCHCPLFSVWIHRPKICVVDLIY